MSIDFPIYDASPSYWIFVVFLMSSVFLLLYLLLFWARFAFYRPAKIRATETLPVTVIIAARNEEDNLYNNIELILNQDYPAFEVIVVNHQSIDNSKHILIALQKIYPHLRVIEIEKNRHLKVGKKLPITLGIKAAKHEHLLFTDADCKPVCNQWIRLMAENFSEKKDIVLGYGPYTKAKGFLNTMIRFDTIQIAINYFSFALNGLPYMGVGRNMAYKKQRFTAVGGFRSHYGIPSGDDDLFIRDAANRKNTAIELRHESFCFSESKNTWADWFKQKRRHYGTSHEYKVFTRALLGLFPMMLVLQLVTFVSLLFFTDFRFWALALFFGVLLLRWFWQAINFSKLNAGKLAIFYPFLEYVHIAITAAMFYSKSYHKNQWK
jgi:cellulose synthase/poly-beta-1,6-N-acetylglucosamine synthase-like glycosyltransferase